MELITMPPNSVQQFIHTYLHDLLHVTPQLSFPEGRDLGVNQANLFSES